MYGPISEIFVTPHSEITGDDELVSHKNVQKKSVNNCKAGKEGAKSDLLCVDINFHIRSYGFKLL